MRKFSSNMVVVFRRTGERRYAVDVKRPPFRELEMDPAPGYDRLMPHDLMHMVVEAGLELEQGIFGQLSSGGDAGTFRPTFNARETSREIARLRRRVKRRGTKLLQDGRNDCAQSERAAFICWLKWQGKDLKDVGGENLPELNQKKLDQICEHLDELSSCWCKVEVGQSMAVRWPDLAIVAAEEGH
jgi:hypothetical protein